MELTNAIRASIDKSVLCWLATASVAGVPNVSPKEIFTYFGTDEVIVANIASPQTVRNVLENENVCVSFVDILVQKGFQLKGKARIIDATHPEFADRAAALTVMTDGKFPFNTITVIHVERIKPVLAPRYLLYPETTEAEQILSARKTYGL